MGFFDGAFGSIINAGASLFGGASASEDAQDAQREAQMFAQQQANLQYERQKEFAQSGIQWRAADAKAAGIHPLYAMGAQTMPFTAGVTMSEPRESGHMGKALANIGQDVSRSMRATMTAEQRGSDVMAGLQLERAQLENDFLRARIAKETGQIGPPMPGVFDANLDGSVDVNPSKLNASTRSNAGVEAGPVSDVGFSTNADGSVSVIPGTNVKERIEDVGLYGTAHSLRNIFLTNFSPESYIGALQEQMPARPGYHWEWSYPKQSFHQVLSVQKEELPPVGSAREWGPSWFRIKRVDR